MALKEPSISVTGSANCGFMTIEDIATYPMSTSYTQGLVARALFYSIDAYSTIEGYDYSNPGSAIFPAIWNIPIVNINTYNISIFYVIDWNCGVSTSFANGSICFYLGDFYVNASGGILNNTTDPPPNPTTDLPAPKWEKIKIGNTLSGYGVLTTDDDLYAVFYNVLVTSGSTQLGFGLANFKNECALFDLERTDCHQWTVSDNTGGYTIGDITFTKYDGTSLDTTLSFASNELTINLDDYDEGGDGVYLLDIEYNDGLTDITAEFVIYDLCDAKTCYDNLFKYIYCKCNDPCDDGCEDVNDMDSRMYDMTLIFGLINTIEQKVYVDRFQYIGVLSISDERNDFILEVGVALDKLKLVTDRCGLCSDEDTNVITDC